MQKISPLRASLDAFNRFKAQRAQKNENNAQKNENNAQNHSNPFGITFKGNLIQMDVFESSKKAESKNPAIEKLNAAGKFAASAWVSTLNKFGSMKQSVISFGNRLKENTVNTWNKLNETKIELDFFKNSPSSLAKKPVSELENMFKDELSAIAV